MGCGAVRGSARAGGETVEVAEGWLEGRDNARPVHGTAQNPFHDVMARRDVTTVTDIIFGYMGLV
jgi:hypothetical protein